MFNSNRSFNKITTRAYQMLFAPSCNWPKQDVPTFGTLFATFTLYLNSYEKTPRFSVSIIIAYALNAQPVLTAANSNFVIGDTWHMFTCSASSVTPGVAGTGIVWDYSSLTVTRIDTLEMVTCASTPYCDSFPASIMAMRRIRTGDSAYAYFVNVGGRLEQIGGHSSPTGPGYVHYQKRHKATGPFPKTYGSAWRDTALCSYYEYPVRYHHQYRVDSYMADGYGVLKTPAGTFTNALKISGAAYTADTIYSLATGTLLSVSADTFQYQEWYQPGIHAVLFSMLIDNGMPQSAVYTLPPLSTAVEEIGDKKNDFVVYPIPAGENIRIKSQDADWPNTIVTLIDLAGKELWHSAGTSTVQDEITIPLSNLGNGIYLLRMQTPTSMITKKLVIDKR